MQSYVFPLLLVVVLNLGWYNHAVNGYACYDAPQKGENCLTFIDLKMSWDDASDYCEKSNISLPVINDGNEYNTLFHLIKDHTTSIWVGANHRSGSWRWNSAINEEIPEPFWAMTHNELGDPIQENEVCSDDDCCSYMDRKRFYFLASDKCDNLREFMCEGSRTQIMTYLKEKSVTVDETDYKECEKGWIKHNDKCYMPMEPSDTFYVCKHVCMIHKSSIAHPEEHEKKFVIGLFGEDAKDSHMWLGLPQIPEEGSNYNYQSGNLPAMSLDDGSKTFLPANSKQRFCCVKENVEVSAGSQN